jgi:methylenetetrahydrofolate--tRNA-(uracil-5-)-methyltransferase
VTRIPESSERAPVILATGPLTSDALAAEIAALVGSSHLYFYDAISPIVLAESIDRSKIFRASRWNRSLRSPAPIPRGRESTLEPEGRGCSVGGERGWGPASSEKDGEGDYLNCPLTRAEYEAFYQALVTAESATVHDFDKERFFEGCLPIEVMAHRGVDTLRFGPMKPVGLIDPRTGREPYACVQLRQDTLAGDHFSLVGFQTQIKWGEQARVLRMIPGLEHAEFVRYGMVHRNTYVNGPTILAETWQVRARPTLFFAGQMSGVEGYVESAASGLVAGLNAAALAQGRPTSAPPRTSAIGALAYYASHADPAHYEPSNITFGIMPPPSGSLPRGRQARNSALADRALADLDAWIHARTAQSVPAVSPV